MIAPADTGMTVLQTRDLSRRFPGAREYALRDVSIEVRRGEVLAVVGESGCGKTTLLRLIAGLDVPTAGSIVLRNAVVSGPGGVVAPERRGVGLVFQDYALFPHLCVLDNIAFGLHALKRAERRRRALELLELVGLAGEAARYPHELSGGQQQRVALARALAPEPAILLLDEPFSNLDVLIKGQVREEVGEILRRTGTTALIVVHDLEDVLALADRIAILKRGALQQVDSPQRVYQRPADEYVARLFGATNLLPGSPRAGGFDTPLGFVPSSAAGRVRGPVTLSIRPQDIEIGDDPDAVAATVRQTRFCGDHQEIVLNIAATDGSVHRILAFARVTRAIRVGDTLHVRAAPAAVRVLGDPL